MLKLRAHKIFKNSKSSQGSNNFFIIHTNDAPLKSGAQRHLKISNFKSRTYPTLKITNMSINCGTQLMLTTLTSARIIQLQKSTSNLVMYNLNQSPRITSGAPSVFTKVRHGPPSINTLNSEFKIKSGAPINKGTPGGPQSEAQPAVKSNHIGTVLCRSKSNADRRRAKSPRTVTLK